MCFFCGKSDLYQLFSKRSYVRFHEYEETNHLIRGVGARMAYTLLTAAITFTFFGEQTWDLFSGWEWMSGFNERCVFFVNGSLLLMHACMRCQDFPVVMIQ